MGTGAAPSGAAVPPLRPSTAATNTQARVSIPRAFCPPPAIDAVRTLERRRASPGSSEVVIKTLEDDRIGYVAAQEVISGEGEQVAAFSVRPVSGFSISVTESCARGKSRFLSIL